MVNDPFKALSHPIRRGIVERLSTGPATVGEATAGFGVSKPAISKHLKVLEETGVVTRSIEGRSHRLTLDPAMFEQDAMIFPEGAGSGLCYGAEGGPELRFRFENLPNLALWTKPGAPYVCIEPWHGTAAVLGGSDDLAKRPYGKILDPGEAARFAFTVEIPE